MENEVKSRGLEGVSKLSRNTPKEYDGRAIEGGNKAARGGFGGRFIYLTQIPNKKPKDGQAKGVDASSKTTN